jgi:hypothetical protein
MNSIPCIRLLLAAAAVSAADADPLVAVRARLPADFDARLASGECATFPEGDLYPYVLPALAYANLAVSGLDRAAAGTAVAG